MEGSLSSVKRWKELVRCLKFVTAGDLKILYKRNGLVAISKPYGMPVHPGPRQGTSVLDLMKRFKEIHNLKQAPCLLHRLDKDASGLLLLSYDDDMTRKIAELFKERKIHKTYLGVTNGVPNAGNGVIVDRMCEGIVGKQKRHRMVNVRDFQSDEELVSAVPDAEIMKAYTAYTVLDSNGDTCALIRFLAKTGYKHQIRLHSASSLNCPILGDHKFSSFDNGPQRLPLRLLQLLDIQGTHTITGKKGHIRPWQRALIPLHLFAESVEIPEIRNDSKPLVIKAQLPSFFNETLLNCKLDLRRNPKTLIHSQEKKLRIFESKIS